MVTKAGRTKVPLPKTISAAEFKAKCLDLMDSVAASGDSITVTKRGKPVAVLAPIRDPARSAFGFMKGRGQMFDDLVSPIAVVWDATR